MATFHLPFQVVRYLPTRNLLTATPSVPWKQIHEGIELLYEITIVQMVCSVRSQPTDTGLLFEVLTFAQNFEILLLQTPEGIRAHVNPAMLGP